ncbi:Fe(3+)-hydroxamate ABC transporter permease FhuB [Aurantimonas sp. Leaf443]|uniref:Fe(3+)-hydroxamate ABC transporter permease FhuB n=1 Tax=Aurantimonas sp. Leaf443 TaxID=1736378 RepID=UPI0006F30AAB|nr:Fe(3+)-hydroxamate ABC transporter permease FhuB [Aurantimonas sp. Leaf443]KQT85392.1 iron ABC transporter [Aurantimonas sp. Leaf443]
MSAAAQRAPHPARLLAALALLCAAALAVLLAGPAGQMLAGAGALPEPERLVLVNATLPRLAMALLCGAALGLSGALLQQVLRNPLASPTTLGIDAGARLALTLATLYAPAMIGWGRDLSALAGSAATTALVFALTRRQGFAPVPLVLSGLVVTLYCGALSAMLTLLESRYLVSLFIWGGGSLAQQSWDPALALSWRLAVLLPFVVLLLRPLRLLDLGEDGARALGLPVGALRLGAVALALLLSAFVTASVGVIGFVGLVAPLVARLAGARGLGTRLLASAAVGGLLLLLTDLGVQLAAGAASDFLPTGAVTAILGSPILLWLLPRLSLAARPPEAGRAPDGRPARSAQRLLAALGLGFGLLLLVALLLGRDPGGAWTWLRPEQFGAILPWRMPRVFACAAAGAMLGTAGLVLQRLTGNGMASPEVFGVSAGAAFGAAVALLAADTLLPGAGHLGAPLGAAVVLALVLAFAQRSGFAPERVLLAGVAINALLDALVGMLSATGDPRAVQLLSLLSGATGGLEAGDAGRAAFLAAAFLAAALLARRWLLVLPLGGPAAQALGLPLARARLALLFIVAGTSAGATVIVGPLSFVGLMAPHIATRLGARRPGPALAAAALVGAALIVTADFVGRTAAFPFQLPAGLLAALVGAPFLLVLLQGAKARSR